jgi:predicted lipid-binding transport protein (Tim44 family)
MPQASDGAPFESKRCPHYVVGWIVQFRMESLLTAIVILALVALFIGLRLYSVLGERTGHEQPILKPADSEQADTRLEPRAAARAPAAAGAADPDDMAYLPTAGPGVRALLAADPSFDVARFLEGSKSAYRLILEAFWKGDLEAMRPYVDNHVFQAFANAVEQRSKDGLVLDNRLVAIEQAVVAGAELDRSVALVTVRFEADIAAVTRNADGDVVAGSLSDAVQTRDRWTFRRDIASNDPNWLLVETDEEE